MKKITLLIICILFTVSCKTVKEKENEMKEEAVHFESPVYRLHEKFDNGDGISLSELDAEIARMKARGEIHSSTSEIREIEPPPPLSQAELSRNNHLCRQQISISPNPVTSVATINIGVFGDNRPFGFKYKLIFEGEVVFEDFIRSARSPIIIPENLLQKNGRYVVEYEIFIGANVHCANSVTFTVTK